MPLDPANPNALRYEMLTYQARIFERPHSLYLHQELRRMALKYKAAGGRGPGVIQAMKIAPNEPRARLIHYAELWSLDPDNLDWLQKLLAAVQRLHQAHPEHDFAPVRRWLYGVLRASRGGA